MHLDINQVGTDAVEHHSGTEAFLGRFVCLGYLFKGSSKHFADTINAVVPSLGEGLDVLNGVPGFGILDVVFGWSGCVHPRHAEQKIRVWCFPMGATFTASFVHYGKTECCGVITSEGVGRG